MSVPTLESTPTQLVQEVTLQDELHRVLGLSPDQAVVSWDALNRRDYDPTMRRIGGAMVVQVFVAGPGISKSVRREFEVDDVRRPLPEEFLGQLGKRAIDNQRGLYTDGRRYDIESIVFTR